MSLGEQTGPAYAKASAAALRALADKSARQAGRTGPAYAKASAAALRALADKPAGKQDRQVPDVLVVPVVPSIEEMI